MTMTKSSTSTSNIKIQFPKALCVYYSKGLFFKQIPMSRKLVSVILTAHPESDPPCGISGPAAHSELP